MGEKNPCESRDTSNRSHFHHPVRHEATVVIFVSAHYSACASSYYCRERGLGGSELPRVPFASTTLSPLPRQLSTYPPTPPLLSWILERRSAPVPLLPRIGRAPASTGGRGPPSPSRAAQAVCRPDPSAGPLVPSSKGFLRPLVPSSKGFLRLFPKGLVCSPSPREGTKPKARAPNRFCPAPGILMS